MYDFTGKVAMITGASGNLGTAVTRAFHDAGAKLAIIERTKGDLEKRYPDLVGSPDCFMSGCADLTDRDEVSGVISAALAQFGQIDFFVNTVGGYRAGKPLHETPLETFDFMLFLNARTTYITSQCIIPHMLEQGAGSIVHLAARPGLKGTANHAAYSASKAAVIRLTESASAELKSKGINVNCVLPGTLDTPQNRVATPEADFGRWVRLESLAGVILFLCSEAGRDIHGASIPVYGLS
jgi:NAD(P)-dependent dehydrogenase (short-subunit alcohol dehydrogenase family)